MVERRARESLAMLQPMLYLVLQLAPDSKNGSGKLAIALGSARVKLCRALGGAFNA